MPGSTESVNAHVKLHEFGSYKVDPYDDLIHAANLALHNIETVDWLVAKPTIRQAFYNSNRRKELIKEAEEAVIKLHDTTRTGNLAFVTASHVSDLLAELRQPSVDNSKILRAYFVIVYELCHHLPDRDNGELTEQNLWGRKDVEDILRQHIFRPLSMSVEEQERKDKELRCRGSCRRRTTTTRASHSDFSHQGDDEPGNAALSGQQIMVRRDNSSSFRTSSVPTRHSGLVQQLNRGEPASRPGRQSFVVSHFSRSGVNVTSYSLGIERRTGHAPTRTVHPNSLSGRTSTTEGGSEQRSATTGRRRRRQTAALERALARYDEERSQLYELLEEDPSLQVTLRTVDNTGRPSTSSSIVFHTPARSSEGPHQSNDR